MFGVRAFAFSFLMGNHRVTCVFCWCCEKDSVQIGKFMANIFVVSNFLFTFAAHYGILPAFAFNYLMN